MPSGVPIDWDKYIPLMRQHLPHMTVKDWRNKYASNISERRIRSKIQSLNITFIPNLSSPERSKKISDALKKDDPEMILQIRKMRQDYSLAKIAEVLNTNTRLISAIIKRHGIILTDEGKARALNASKNSLTAATKKKLSSVAHRQKLSIVQAKRKSRGLKTYRSSTLTTKKGGTLTTKSSYETRYCYILDSDPNVKSFAYETINISYYWNKLRRFYVPDFLVKYVDGTFCVVEIKPSKLLKDPRNMAKFKAAKEHILPFKIVTEIELKVLES